MNDRHSFFIPGEKVGGRGGLEPAAPCLQIQKTDLGRAKPVGTNSIKL